MNGCVYWCWILILLMILELLIWEKDQHIPHACFVWYILGCSRFLFLDFLLFSLFLFLFAFDFVGLFGLLFFLIFLFVWVFCFVLVFWSLFVLLYFFFWPLCCQFFYDLRILITPVVSYNCSFHIYVEMDNGRALKK